MQRALMIGLSLLGVVAVVAAGIAVWANIGYRQRMAEAETAWNAIAARAAPAAATFAPDTVADLPEIARRYFTHAIAPGTPLSTTVELTMTGRFRLGEPGALREFDMEARQILAPPAAFVWLPEMHAGPMRITGSDGLVEGRAWTRFWMFGLIPLVQAAATEGLDRAALARPALEAIWVPASLLPRNGAQWEQIDADTARIRFGEGESTVEIEMVLDTEGRVLSVWTMRWSDANPERAFRLQPFGGDMRAEASFAGFTVPSEVEVGNHYGTPDYFPFFLATITEARYR